MPDKRSSLNNLLESDEKANRYFKTLPGNAQDFLMQSDEEYNSLPELQRAADRLLQSNGVNHD